MFPPEPPVAITLNPKRRAAVKGAPGFGATTALPGLQVTDVAFPGFQGRNRRHTYAPELLRAGVGLPALMNLLGHVDPDMTMRYLNVTLTDLKQEFQLARSEPRHLMPRANPSVAPFRVGLAGVTDVLSGAHHVLEMFRRTLPDGPTRSSLDRLSNRLTKITPSQRASAPAKPGQNGR